MPRSKPRSFVVASTTDEDHLDQYFARTIAAQPVLRDLPVDRIDPNPFQPRRSFTAIEDLAVAIRQHGFISRLRVRPHPEVPDRFQLVYGERRLRAATAAGLGQVPVEIVATSEQQMMEIGLLENVQRADLQPLEEAHALAVLIEQHGYTQQALAERLGKQRGYITNRLELLKAPPDVQQLVEHHPETLSTARRIARVKEPAVREALIDAAARGVPYRQIAEAAEAAERGAVPSPAPVRKGTRRNTATLLGSLLTDDLQQVAGLFARCRQSLPQATQDEIKALETLLRESIQPALERLVAETASYVAAEELLAEES